MKTCSTCPTYSRALGRCKDGKIVPKTIKGGKDAVKFMGASYICPKTPGYQKIVFRSIWDTDYDPGRGQIDYSGRDSSGGEK